MSETLLYCKNYECEISDCPYNIEHLDPRTFDKCKSVHLEDNPNYCKKPNWYGYQVKEAKDEV